MSPRMKRIGILSAALLLATAIFSLTGCAAPRREQIITLPAVADETQVVVACPDDGLHAVVDGKCVGGDDPIPKVNEHLPFRHSQPCPQDGRHQRVNGVCVDVDGK